jgi:hypothetical protein
MGTTRVQALRSMLVGELRKSRIWRASEGVFGFLHGVVGGDYFCGEGVIACRGRSAAFLGQAYIYTI